MKMFGTSGKDLTPRLVEVNQETHDGLKEEYDALKQESIDFADLMQQFHLYSKTLKEFIRNPIRDNITRLDYHLGEFLSALKKIGKESHNIDHLLRWLKVHARAEQAFVSKVKVESMSTGK